jgi:hypothetical protein
MLLLLGAIVNLAVAWCLALLIDGLPSGRPTRLGVTSTQHPFWRLNFSWRPGTTVLTSEYRISVRPAPPRPQASPEEINAWLEQQSSFDAGEPTPPPKGVGVIAAPYWSRASTPPQPEREEPLIIEDARGWPMRSLMSYVRPDLLARNITPTLRDTWLLETGGRTPVGIARGLPLKPILPGFFLNSMAYAVVLWLVFSAIPQWMRRRIEAKRGCCIHCGYDLRGKPADTDKCPECGKGAGAPRAK